MRNAVVCLLILCVARVASAGHPERFLDWEEVPAPPGQAPARTVAAAAGVLYAGTSDAGVHQFDTRTETWKPYGLAGLRVWKLAGDGDALYAYINNGRARGLYRAKSRGDWAKVPSSSDDMGFSGVSHGVAYVHTDGLNLMDVSTGALTPVSLLVRDVDIRRLAYQRRGTRFHLSVATEAGQEFALHEHRDTWFTGRHGPPGMQLRGAIHAKEYDVVATDLGLYSKAEDYPGWSASNSGLPSLDVIAAVRIRGGYGREYAAVRSAGVYRSLHGENRGGFTPLNEGLPSLDVIALAASGEGDERGLAYVVVSGHGVYVLVEDESVWRAVGSPEAVAAAVCIAVGDEEAYAGLPNGDVLHWRWGDPRQQWRAAPTPVPGGDLRALAATPDGLYAAGRAGLFVTRDEGVSWEPVALRTHSAAAMATHGSTQYVGTSEGMIFRSEEGKSWSYLRPELRYGRTLDIAVADGAVYAVGGHGAFALPAGADDWVRLSPGGMPNDGIVVPGEDIGSGVYGRDKWSFRAIAIVGDVIYGATGAGIVRARRP